MKAIPFLLAAMLCVPAYAATSSACNDVLQARSKAAQDARTRRQQQFDNSIGATINRTKQSCLDNLLKTNPKTVNTVDLGALMQDFIDGAIDKACSMVQSETDRMFSSNGIGTSMPYGLEGISASSSSSSGSFSGTSGSFLGGQILKSLGF